MYKKLLFLAFSALLFVGMVGCKKNGPSLCVDTISFNAETYTLEEGDNLNLIKRLVITPEEVGDTVTIEWSSSPSDIVDVSNRGILTALKTGTATVTATSGGKSATCTVKVNAVPITAFTLDKTAKGEVSTPIKVGLSVTPSKASQSQLNLMFEGSGSTDISYYFEGNDLYVLSDKVGSYKLKASYGDLPSQTCSVTITAKLISSVSVTPDVIKLEIGSTKQLSVKVDPVDATYANVINYVSDNLSVATVDSKGYVTLKAEGAANITIKVGKEVDGETIHTVTCRVVAAAGKITDICGNSYNTVKIGSQIWMAENMKCDKYDKQSEAYNAGIKSIVSSDKVSYTSYYHDGRQMTSLYSNFLTPESREKLGYLYNWAAAVGVADGVEIPKGYTGKNRQGICPNGWHVPNSDDWNTLINYIEKSEGKGTNMAGKHLKAVYSGWHSSDYNFRNGLDTYGYEALPAGYMEGNAYNSSIGKHAWFWEAETFSSSKYAPAMVLINTSNQFSTYYQMHGTEFNEKSNGMSVRCLKN